MAIEVLALSDIINKLKANVTALKQVEGAAALEQAMRSGARLTPAAFIVPLGEQSQANQLAVMAVQQRTTASFGVVLAVRDVSDASGASAMDQDLSLVRKSLLQALLGFSPNASWGSISHISGSLLRITNGTLWWQDKFQTETYRSSV